MSNERLRVALLKKGMTPAQLAEQLQVDLKTAERWIGGREPYRKHRFAVATLLGVEESYLWPQALPKNQVSAASEGEIISVYPHRWAVPREVWTNHFAAAETAIDMLTMAGIFIVEDSGTVRLFRKKAEDGVAVRFLINDPDSAAVAIREKEEGTGQGVLAARVRNVLALLRPLRGVDNIETRLHDACLYTSIFRSDDDLIINAHVHGVTGANAPVLHLRKVAGGDLVSLYRDSFERIWNTARPLESAE